MQYQSFSRAVFSCGWLALLAVSCAGQTQSFPVGPWFFGKNVSSELPPGVIDFSDNMWASETYTCPLLMMGNKAAPTTQLSCRPHLAGNPFRPVIAEGDARLAGTRLAIPVQASHLTGRYVTSMVRPGPRNLYFTSVTMQGIDPQTFSHQIAWRYRNYTALERVAGAGDTVAAKLINGTTANVQLTAAGPVDANPNGREFIYLEAAGSSLYGIFEIKADGVFELVFQSASRIPMRDTPWGMGGFVFDDGGLVFKQGISLYQVDPDTRQFLILAQERLPFLPPSTRIPDLQLGQLFRPVHDPLSFFFTWAKTAEQYSPPEFVVWWKNWGWSYVYENQVGTPMETTAATFAQSERVTVMGAGPRGPGAIDYDPSSRNAVEWAFSALWFKFNGAWTKLLRDADLPEGGPGSPKKFYQGVTAHGCEVDFATKRNDGSNDNSGPFFGLYRLYRPCIDTAEFNTSARELVIKGTNLQDQKTEVLLPQQGSGPGGALAGLAVPLKVISASPIEVHAALDSAGAGDEVFVQINGSVASDTAKIKVTTTPAPILADLTDVNFDHTPAAAGKLMTLTGAFGCQTAQTQTVNYPSTLGTCAVLLNNAQQLPLLYTSDSQIDFLFPAGLPVSTAYQLRVTRTDSNGVFSSDSFPLTLSPNNPVPFKYQGNVIVQVVRNGQAILLGPDDPIHPGEYFTIYLTGVNMDALSSTMDLGGAAAQYAAAAVDWAQGVVQMNILAPPMALGAVQFRISGTPAATFPVRIN